ncbi:MAG TPA: hypothetical protein DET40_07070 [Lentisphaeria bacterium]|nr:MAG: hypothetical protein A2X45_07230 [Lentisphaerae bacterium GWF2_50_93]HCE43292.1 hypothetical protein [Lentisphaeria bacterium]
MGNTWVYEEKTFRADQQKELDAVFSLGNGYVGCRGFSEEEQGGLGRLGGIYMAGVFGRGKLKAWEGMHRELVNTPNCFSVKIRINGEPMLLRTGRISDYSRTLNMREGTLERSFTWNGLNGQKVRFRFERFVSMDDLHVSGQRIEVSPVNGNPDIEIAASIDADVTNLFVDTLLDRPVHPGLRHLKTVGVKSQIIEVKIESLPDGVIIAEGQEVSLKHRGSQIRGTDTNGESLISRSFKYKGIKGETAVLTKLIHVFTSRDGEIPPSKQVEKSMARKLEYSDLLNSHKSVWSGKWHSADIEIDGSDNDQRAMRFNIFQLIQACPSHDHRLSIGARGLTGEMHEGGIFWDTEIFKLPFFTLTDPAAAASLLRFRHGILPEARRHAKALWFQGAMYAWKSGLDGAEETEVGVGAYYAIHIISDISYAIRQYWEGTGDSDFMHKYGTEILIETARFWKSRAHYDPIRRNYSILAVRGPNEYGVIVNNNLYTNMMAAENLRYAIDAIGQMKKENPKAWSSLSQKIKFNAGEITEWKKIIGRIVICHDAKTDLYLEDDMYLHRVPFDMKRGKPTGKRVIDSTLPYEAMAMYQITKQSDVVCLMNLLPWKFTEKQRRIAYDYYEPRTAHDSSLSYSPHGVITARLGLLDDAYRYFKESAYLDITDLQLNTISGLHFANFGGTWQIAVMGFGGVHLENGRLVISPNLPKAWKKMSFRLACKGALLRICISKKSTEVTLEKSNGRPLELLVGKELLQFRLNGDVKTLKNNRK